jgi:hypothetical protein
MQPAAYVLVDYAGRQASESRLYLAHVKSFGKADELLKSERIRGISKDERKMLGRCPNLRYTDYHALVAQLDRARHS